MKALTIHQPWASLIIAGAKPFEFRKWAVPRAIVGTRIVIHASLKPIDRDEVQKLLAGANAADILPDEWAAAATGLDPDKARPILMAALEDTGSPPRPWRGDLPWGAALGTAVIGEAIPAHLIAELGDSTRIDHHVMGWPMTDVQPFPEPVPCRGAQGFWAYSRGFRDMVAF